MAKKIKEKQTEVTENQENSTEFKPSAQPTTVFPTSPFAKQTEEVKTTEENNKTEKSEQTSTAKPTDIVPTSAPTAVVPLSPSTELIPDDPRSIAIFNKEDNGEVIEFTPDLSKTRAELKFDEVDFNGFYDLAELLNKDVYSVVEDCYIYQLRCLMNKIGKVVVRFNISADEIGNILYNTHLLNAKEALFSPAFIPVCRKEINKDPSINQNVGAIIDFPMGESSLKTKLIGVRECINKGVDGVTVMVPSMLFAKDKAKELKKHIKKISKQRGAEIGVAVSAMDVDEAGIKSLTKFVDKFKTKHVTYVFGNVTEGELNAKIAEINKYRTKKELRVLANINTIKGVTVLVKSNVDVILTPYADDIGKELIAKFKIKSLKLL